MDLLSAVILGVVEGLTEFLPISSTGHLIVASTMLGLAQDEFTKAFEVIIQLGAILAVLANYRERCHPRHYRLWLKVALAFLPIGTIGFFFHAQVKAMFSMPLVAAMFIAGGVVFLLLEWRYRPEAAHTRELERMTVRQALWIGLAQAFALVPGTSRAGATIVGALLVGLDRRAAAEFSFLMALPVLASASAYDFITKFDQFTQANLAHLAAAFVVSFLVAVPAMRIFVRFLQSHSFVVFAVYRIVFGGALLLWLYGS